MQRLSEYIVTILYSMWVNPKYSVRFHKATVSHSQLYLYVFSNLQNNKQCFVTYPHPPLSDRIRIWMMSWVISLSRRFGKKALKTHLSPQMLLLLSWVHLKDGKQTTASPKNIHTPNILQLQHTFNTLSTHWHWDHTGAEVGRWQKTYFRVEPSHRTSETVHSKKTV